MTGSTKDLKTEVERHRDWLSEWLVETAPEPEWPPLTIAITPQGDVSEADWERFRALVRGRLRGQPVTVDGEPVDPVRHYRVMARGSLSLREQPALDKRYWIGGIPYGAIVERLGSDYHVAEGYTWVKVKYAPLGEGWCAKEFLEEVL